MIAAARAHAGVPAAAALRARAPRRARSLIARAVDPESSGKSYYKVVNGVKLDRKVVDDCVAFEKNDGKIDMAEAERVFNDIVDGPKRRVGGANETDTTVTNVELDTMQYCFDTFQWEDDAKSNGSTRSSPPRTEDDRATRGTDRGSRALEAATTNRARARGSGERARCER